MEGRRDQNTRNERQQQWIIVMPGYHHSVAVLPLLFRRSCRCKIPLFCKNYVRKFRSVTAVNSKNIRNGSGNGNGVRKRQRLTGTAKRQRKNGNGMVETGHYAAHASSARLFVACVLSLYNSSRISSSGSSSSSWVRKCREWLAAAGWRAVAESSQ